MDKSVAGKSFAPYEFRVERGKIKEFADFDRRRQPDYRDPVVAAQAGFAGIPAPPTLLRTFLYETSESRSALGVKDWSYIVHGEQEFEYLAPVVAGDVLTARDRIVSITEKDSKRAGTLQIGVIETVFKNQRGETVQIARRTWSRPASASASERHGPAFRTAQCRRRARAAHLRAAHPHRFRALRRRLARLQSQSS